MEHVLKHFKTFRYETLNGDNNPSTVIYVLHGYGQLAKFFIQKFKTFDKKTLIVAPEGMHRFYLKGSSGRVGASWMTKEARESDIADNIEWLNALDEKISAEYPIERRILIGFSQGGATAIRWKLSARNSFHQTIIWASDFPPDMEPRTEELQSEETNHFVIGSTDEFYDTKEQERLIRHYKNANFKISMYIGPHEIDTLVLDKLLDYNHANS